MNPDEFEEYLGLQGGNLAAAAGFDHQEFYYGTEPQKNRDFTENSIGNEDVAEQQHHQAYDYNQRPDDSVSENPVVSAGMTEGDK